MFDEKPKAVALCREDNGFNIYTQAETYNPDTGNQMANIMVFSPIIYFRTVFSILFI